MAGDSKVIEAAQDMFAKFAAGDRKAIHSNIRGSVYAIVLQNGGEKEYDIILNEFRTVKDATEKNTALRSLGRGKGEELMKRTVSLPLSDEVKAQDVYLPIVNLRSHAAGIEALWTWLMANWEPLQEKCPPSLTMLGTIVQICTSSFTKTEQLEQVQTFFKGKSTKGFERALGQASDVVRSNNSWVERDAGDVERWLEKEGYLGKAGEKL